MSMQKMNMYNVNSLYIFCTVYHMMETGWVKVSQTDVGPLHYQYQEEKLAAGPGPGTSADLS